jgi:hypothetical protein
MNILFTLTLQTIKDSPFSPVHRTEVLLGTLHILTQGKRMLYSQLYASINTSFSSNKTIIHNTKHRCDKFQMFSPALCMASVSEENFTVLATYSEKCILLSCKSHLCHNIATTELHNLTYNVTLKNSSA